MHTNRLIDETSPYLLQHAHNPVQWYPWGEVAFAKARSEGKPVFLSVGYSTCHWCHVMAHESFENEAVAAILNDHFISIKVDREERPDVDRVYMTYVQATTGGGGWPMSVWLTPDLKPFIGGTYYPPEDRWGRPGFKSLLLQIAKAWREQKVKIITSADDVTRQLQQLAAFHADEGSAPAVALLEQGYQQLKITYEPHNGGFGNAPKFPRPVALNFMLRYHARTLRQGAGQTGTQDALEMCLFTLRKMAEGGIHDHLGGGFHRYSVDTQWHVPHFEKMLYDQAQLVCSYLDAFQITHDVFYAEVARDILDYVLRDLTGKEGGFLSAEDADSPVPGNPAEHAEGAFYVWSHQEIVTVLGHEYAEIFNFYYGVNPDGNVESDPQNEFHNKNILIVRHTPEEAGKKFGKSPDTIRAALATARQKLLGIRVVRPRPHLDDKTLTAWNGLMISAFARASQCLDEPRYLAAALRAATFIDSHLSHPGSGKLMRCYRAGAASVYGFADDYAFFIQGLIDLYEASFDVNWLKRAIELQCKQDELFWDSSAGGYFSTDASDPSILLRMKEDYDSAEPSSNSVSALNLLRLAQMTDSQVYRARAGRLFSTFCNRLQHTPSAMPQLLVALDFQLTTPRQIIIAGLPEATDTRTLLREVHSRFIPNKVLLLAEGETGQAFLAQYLPFLKNVCMVDGKATAYICENYSCQLPITDRRILNAILTPPTSYDMNHADRIDEEDKL
ncbi:MAG: thioredoxin domain-containing protein [bacterium]